MTRLIPVLLVAAAALACTRAPAPATANLAQRASPLASPLTADLRLLGVDGASFESVLVRVKTLAVLADGAPIPVTPGARTLDLADGTQSWLLGRVTLPAGTNQVDVTLALDDFGGYVDTNGAGDLDLRGPPIHFVSPVNLLAAQGHAVVHLDLGESLATTTNDGRRLLPVLSVHY